MKNPGLQCGEAIAAAHLSSGTNVTERGTLEMTQDSDPLAQKDKHGKQLGNTKDQYLNIENLIEGRFFQMFLRILQKNRFLWFNCGLTAVYCFSSCTRNVIKITSCLSESLRISAERMLHVLLRFALVGLRQRFRNVSLATC